MGIYILFFYFLMFLILVDCLNLENILMLGVVFFFLFLWCLGIGDLLGFCDFWIFWLIVEDLKKSDDVLGGLMKIFLIGLL